MRSNIAQALSVKFPPLAIFYAQEPPPEAKETKTLCSMPLVAKAAKGKTVAITHGTCGCPGAAEGFGLGPGGWACPEDNFPGGRECFLRFLSIGNKDWDYGRTMIQELTNGGASKNMIEGFTEGEGFLKTPELVAEWLEHLPSFEPEGPYVVIKPLEALTPQERPKVVSFLIDPHQLSALVVLANFARPGIDNVRIPFSAGCAGFGLYPFHEAKQTSPRAVIGLTDISARNYLHKPLGEDILSFTVPLGLFEEMEGNVSESFLTRHAWKSIMGK